MSDEVKVQVEVRTSKYGSTVRKIVTFDREEWSAARFLRTTEKWSGLVYEPFQSEEAKQQHLKEVQEGIEKHGCPF